jgi:KaiC/GvpD/RAD55 family RecA-like ATPase
MLGRKSKPGRPKKLAPAQPIRPASLLDDGDTPAPVEWLTPGIPLKNITVLVGPEGSAKSLLTIRLAADLTRGLLETGAAPVLISAPEDDQASVIVPRLREASADLALVHSARIRDGRGFRSADLSEAGDLRTLEGYVLETGAKLLVLDPWTEHIGHGLHASNPTRVRRALSGLREMAQRTDLAVLLVAHTNNDRALERRSAEAGTRRR